MLQHCIFQVKGLEDKLSTNVETGVSGEVDDVVKRKSTFGTNTYPTKKGKGFLVITLFLFSE